MSLVFLSIFLVMILGDVAWAVAAWRTFAKRPWARAGVLVFLALMLGTIATMLIGRFVGVRPDNAIPPALLGLVFIWHFLGLPVALAAAFGSKITQFILAFQHRRATPTVDTPPDDRVEAISRRIFLTRATAAIAPVALTGISAGVGYKRLSEFRLRRLVVPIAGLPSGIDGLTIAHVSDTHLGRFTSADTFRKIVAAVNDLDADLVLHTGDLINHDQRDLPVAAEMIRAIRGRHGQFLCEGNHDLIEGREPFRAFMKQEQLPLLVDELAGVDVNGVRVELLGLPWQRAPRGQDATLDALLKPAVASLADRRSPGAFPILLAHHPHAFDAARAAGLPLTLSGHTHGGQLNLTSRLGFGAAMYRYWSGLYERDGASAVVSNGAGNWFPLRVNAPAEILHLTLRRA